MQKAVVVSGRGSGRGSVDRIASDPVGFWLRRLDSDSRPAALSHLNRWMRWLHGQSGWETASPRELLVRRLECEDDYEILDLVQTYVGGLVLGKSSKRTAYSTIRSFFDHNRCSLPLDPQFRIRGDRPPVQGKLTIEDIVELYNAASVRYRSIIMVKWQGLLDNQRLAYVGANCAEQVVKQIQAGVNPVRIDFAGRKSEENDIDGSYFTCIAKDAVDAFTKYFDEERGWPKPGEFNALGLGSTIRISKILQRETGTMFKRSSHLSHASYDI